MKKSPKSSDNGLEERYAENDFRVHLGVNGLFQWPSTFLNAISLRRVFRSFFLRLIMFKVKNILFILPAVK